ncbi:MAG: DUF998 domain-containing protein [Lachnospiraceae bacterium]|nr:DUF998 domain-containing protein [Lachnospiraceae bacterium]
MKNKKLTNWFCLSGIIGLVFYVLHDVVGAMHYPDYNWMSQAVSDLTATTAPSFVIASGLSSIYGIFSCLCCAMVCVVVQGKANRALRLGVYLFTTMSFISAVGYALFPLSESGYAGSFRDIMHLYVVTALVVVLSIASLVLIAVGGFKSKVNKPLAVISLISLGFMFLGVIGVSVVPADYFGIPERFSVYSAVVFTAVLGVYGYLEREGYNND